MSREDKNSGTVPRLTVVGTVPDTASGADSVAGDGRGQGTIDAAPGGPGTPAETRSSIGLNAILNIGSDAAGGSPVHDLILSIEQGTSVSTTADSARDSARDSGVVPDAERGQRLRVLEAVIYASAEPVDEARLETYLKPGEALAPLLDELRSLYLARGVNLVKVAEKWAFRTAEDLSWALERHAKQERRLSRAALETLAIVAYHQPVTRAEIEEVRGVTISKGTLDVLMEVGWVRPRGRRRAPGQEACLAVLTKL